MTTTSFYIKLIILGFLLYSCNTGNIEVVANIDAQLEEASALELVKNENVLWTIEDAGNPNILYRLNNEGNIDRSITITNAKNEDWEDLTSDKQGNIYIGDFGNNNKKRDTFTIYKISNPKKLKKESTADIINFTLPKKVDSADFEAFFLHNNYFYMFSKTEGKGVLIKVPNQIGTHVATLITEFKLKGKQTKITGADISDDGKTVVLLNHDKLWKLTNFTSDNFFDGRLESLEFKHDSQKEGVCFVDSKSVLINDERTGIEGGNIYVFEL
ncbi:hypothetical protein [Hwangdonia seohaensis]|uniref:SdiA-regulated family protein n=1 Tax=Hwangdonia seohaensis TaxID=1240727 RepID=A0ABW3R762_9FLAO|nr:hypothetical protein [Hwangdonia seohaensis]